MSNSNATYTERTYGGNFFEGSDVTIFQAIILASALNLYAATGMKVNAGYTPTRMLAAAGQMTGQTFKRGQYIQAADALTALANAMKAAPRTQ